MKKWYEYTSDIWDQKCNLKATELLGLASIIKILKDILMGKNACLNSLYTNRSLYRVTLIERASIKLYQKFNCTSIINREWRRVSFPIERNNYFFS